jgi:DDE superfamily endonuclease
MELTASFVDLLQHFVPVFTTPTFQTFVEIVTGWALSHRRRFVTEVIFTGGNLGNGHWCRFHRFFSHAAWDLDNLSLFLARLVCTILTPGATLFWAVDDTLCRKRGLTLYGAGMHYDPLISSRAKPLVSWGHDWVVLCLIVVKPFWAPSKVFALPIAMWLYRNRQGLTKGEEEPRQSLQTRSQSSYSARTGSRTHRIGGRVVPRRRHHPHRRQRLRGQKHPFSSVGQRSPHQPCSSQGRPLQACPC